MAKQPSQVTKDEREAQAPEAEVAALRDMNREDRLALLMKSLDSTCGPLPSRCKDAAVHGRPPRKTP